MRMPVDEDPGLPVLAPEEYHRQVVEWNATEVARPVTLVHVQVAAQAAERPDAVAVTNGTRSLTYADLDADAGRLARCLREAGVVPEVAVAICLPRSIELVIAMLAVFKAGGTYVPLDPEHPDARLEYMLTDCGAPVLITTDDVRARLSVPECVRVLRPDARGIDPVDAPVDPGNLAYVIYTSGSTGRPKGVAVAHAGLANLVAWHLDSYRIGDTDRVGQCAAVGFDASVWEIWPALAAGATLHIAGDDERLRPDLLLNWLADNRITVTFLPTPLAAEVVKLPSPPGLVLRALLTGGDRLGERPRSDTGYELINHYGPTEASVVTTAGVVPWRTGSWRAPSIGRPIDNVRTYILDHALRPVAIGVSGELHIAGTSLARGYVDSPGLTAERFVPDPFATRPGERMYRTGDLARYRPDGAIEFVGRIDSQVSIRGVRIETGEIEARLREHLAVAEAVVAARVDERENTYLVGYVTPATGGAIDVDAVREHLVNHLPGQMVPAVLVPLRRFPVTSNGKIDVGNLPVPESSGVETPRDPLEDLVAAIWALVLDLPEPGQIDVHANFLTLGGHSLRAHQVIARVNATFDIDLSARALFGAPTIASFADVVRHAGTPGRIETVTRLARQVDEMSDDEIERLLAEHSTVDHPSAKGWKGEQADELNRG
ncbi:non-ribosomal peptide synthetase [Micromonospora sp. NBC_01655]|uniref:non-ribosomal peptide synthetase n=1 Tax=Micromonospora sp. NBC_01655 TaxID=2975983 RepID=UPI00224F62D0|nr:non-ribosomal peptide synthetase [Micromonospora sp. NBC_01655]MCX4471584.1 non-ribosomal peptide synthetase [Micromonospora sp. NBC_01655]